MSSKFYKFAFFFIPPGMLINTGLADHMNTLKPQLEKSSSKLISKKTVVYPRSKMDLAEQDIKSLSQDKEKMKRIQTLLKYKGFKVKETGQFDEETKQALRNYKNEHGFDNNSNLDSRTLESLGFHF